MMLCNELRSKAVEAMRGVSRPSEEDKRPAGPAPIQNLKLYPWLDSHELHLGAVAGVARCTCALALPVAATLSNIVRANHSVCIAIIFVYPAACAHCWDTSTSPMPVV